MEGESKRRCTATDSAVISKKLRLPEEVPSNDSQGGPSCSHIPAAKREDGRLTELSVNGSGTILHEAAQNDDLLMMKSALPRPDVNGKDKVGQTALHIAARKNNVEMMNILIANGGNIDARDINRNTPLHIAAEWNSIDAVKQLLECGVNIDAINNNDEGVLHLLARQSYFGCQDDKIDTVIKLLLERIDNRNKSMETPLHVAVENNNKKITKMLMECRANANAWNKHYQTALGVAVVKKNVSMVRLLVECGADVNARSSGGTVLCYAVEQNDLEMVELLLDLGADVNPVTVGESPLHCAVKANNTELIKLLLERKANVRAIESAYGRTPLYYAPNEVVVKQLMEYGADIRPINIYGETILHYVAKTDNIELLALFLKLGLYVNARDWNNGITPLICAQSKDAVELLLDHGANIDAMSEDNISALSNAMLHNNEEIVKTLLDHGAIIDSKTHFHEFCEAVSKNHVGVVKLLLEHGANINVHDGHGHTTSKEFHYVEASNVLKQHIIKLQAAGFYVCERNLKYLQTYDCRAFRLRCDDEVERMKSAIFANCPVTFYDILTEDMPQLYRYAKNENIVTAIETGIYKEAFPLYCDLITTKFDKAKKRETLLKHAVHCLNVLLSYPNVSMVVIPSDVAEYILNYFHYRDLEMIIKACPNTDI